MQKYSLIVLIILTLFSGCFGGKEGKERISIVCAVNSSFIGDAAFNIALKKGFFEEEGFDVSIIRHAAGWKCFKELLEGKADVSHVADLPLVYTAFDRTKYTDKTDVEYYIFADLIYTNKMKLIIGRKDRGIESPEDIKGKKVGIAIGTSVDFYLDAFLIEYNINPEEIDIINMPPNEQIDALASGELDIIFTWQPHAFKALKLLGEKAVVMDTRLNYPTSWLVTMSKEFVEKNPGVMERYLRVYKKTNEFIRKNRDEAVKIHAEYSGTDKEIIDALWDDIDFSISLGESLITTMEDEARWLIRKGMTDSTEVPNFLNYLHFEAMEKVKPEGITLIR